VVVQEGQGLAGFQGLQPQADPAQFRGHGVEVDAIQATPDHVA
jgi:thioredoxin-like negative regulator of GroEL